MINKIFIYLCYFLHRIVINLFFISLLSIAAIGVITMKPIPKLVGYIFFFVCGLYVGIWVYIKAMDFLAKERAKGNNYAQKLVDNYRKSKMVK